MLAGARRETPRSPKSKRPKTTQTQKPRVIIESSDDSDSEDNQPLDTILLRIPVKFAAREEAVAAGQKTREVTQTFGQNGRVDD